MLINLYQLYRTTKLEILEARAEARSGRKESARAFLRYIRNGRILEILNRAEFPETLPADVALLRWEFSQLETECHPSTQLDQTSDIKAIRTSMDIISHFVISQNKQTNP